MQRIHRRTRRESLRAPRRAGLSVTLALGLLAGCGDDGGPGPIVPDPEPADMTAYVGTLPSWSAFSPLKAEADTATDNASAPDVFSVGPTQYSCTTTPFSLTQNPDRITIFNPDSEILWLGALLQGKGHLGGLGSLAELPIRQRAPLTVFIDLLSENVTRSITDPDPASVQAAIGALVEQATAAGHKAGNNIFFDKQETHSVQQGSLSLGVSARYMGTTITTKLDYEQEREENTLTAYFVQRMYTASMVLPQTSGAVFSDELTQAILDQQIANGALGSDNLPTYISNIVYGRMLMVTMTSSRSYEEMRGALDAANASIGSGSISATDKQILQESNIQVSAVGGDESGLVDLIETGRLGEYLNADIALTQARPLSYTVRNLGDNSIATVSETTSYNLKQCATSAATPTGAEYNLTLDKLELVEDGCDAWPDDQAAEVYYSFSLTTPAGGTVALTSRGASAAVDIAEGGSHNLGMAPRRFSLFAGGGSAQISGNAWDDDGLSGDDRIGTWALSYGYPVSNGQRYFTRSENGCRIRLYLTITKHQDLYS
jgi:hypothetical protein